MTATSRPATDHRPIPESAADPREQITYGVLMENGRLAPRSFRSWEEAEAWAQEGEQAVAWNFVCDCDM